MRNVEVIGNRVANWGEGPLWHEGSLLYVDIHSHLILRWNPDTGEEQVWDVGQQVGFVVPCQSGRLLYGGDHGLFFLDPATGESTPIHDPEPNLPKNRFNDGKCSPDGRLFAGTIAMDKTVGAARLYRLDSDLTCSEAYGPVTNSNGIVWSADASTCYYIDTPSKEIMAFSYDASTGVLSQKRVVVDTSALDGVPDGMAIDSEDRLWVAFCHGGCVVCFDPANGEIRERIEIPARETTACAFGGPAGRDLYITTGLPPSDPESEAGRLFVVRDMAVSGPAGSVFRDEL